MSDVAQEDLHPIRTKYAIPRAVASCHVAVVGDYVIEGHVPGDVIKRVLKEKPKIVGLGVPGMPMGSPGMEAPDGRRERYEILSFDKTGATRVYDRR